MPFPEERPRRLRRTASLRELVRETELSARHSGFSGAEPLAISLDDAGRRWIATRAAGLDVYEPERSD